MQRLFNYVFSLFSFLFVFVSGLRFLLLLLPFLFLKKRLDFQRLCWFFSVLVFLLKRRIFFEEVWKSWACWVKLLHGNLWFPPSVFGIKLKLTWLKYLLVLTTLTVQFRHFFQPSLILVCNFDNHVFCIPTHTKSTIILQNTITIIFNFSFLFSKNIQNCLLYKIK